MFRNYPLTTLFIVATICVDLVIVSTSPQNSVLDVNSGWRFFAWSYLMPAQLSLLGLWSVFGKMPLLTRAACVTLAGGMLWLLHWMVLQEAFLNEAIFFNLVHILIVIVGAAFFCLCGVGRPAKQRGQRFQFSLVEIFGWTIIVALWAFAFRSSAARVLVDKYFLIWMATATIAPLVMVPILFSNQSAAMRLAGLIGAYVCTLLAYGFAQSFYAEEAIVLWAFSMAITQITYISAWWAVARMDEVMQERRAFTTASQEKLALYEPQETDS